MSWIRMNDGWIRLSKAPNPLTASIFFLLDNDVLTRVGQYLDKLKMESSRKFSVEQQELCDVRNKDCYFSVNVKRQIRCLHPGFILYQSDEGEESHPITVEVNPLKKLPLVDWFSAEGAGMVDPLDIELFTKKLENRYSPHGLDIVNQIFTEYLEHNDISRPNRGYDSNGFICWYRAPIWNKSPESRYRIEGPQHIDKTLDERQKGFNDMFISGELDYVLYDDSEGNGGAILVQDWTKPSSIYF